jgi:hypothetical protein
VAIVAAAIGLFLLRISHKTSVTGATWLVVAMTLTLFIPVLANSEAVPRRWLIFGVARLYLAPIVLPLIVFFLCAAVQSSLIFVLSAIAAAIALTLQPDAAQLSAFSVALLVVSLVAARVPRLVGIAVAAILICCNILVWRIPDQLSPVRFVEGVFQLSAEISVFALAAAIACAALPVIALMWISRVAASKAAIAVALYYACLFAMAPLQVTPIPLLGFGAGPILGYMLVAAVISRAVGDLAPPSQTRATAES